MMRIALVILVLLLLLPCNGLTEFSPSSSVYDPDLSQQALQISEMCFIPSMQKAILEIDGFQQIGQFNYDREDEARHVAAYTVYEKNTEDGRHAVIIAIRGTGKGEWPLNLDLMPSGNYSLSYAENFTLAAEDILSAQAEFLNSLTSPVFLITGHSRGAAVANVLGAKLTDRFGMENVYVYTFATPRTVRGEIKSYENLFNVINPADIVTYLPLPQWGFVRYGIDLILPVDDTSLYATVEQAYLSRKDQMGSFSASSEDIVKTKRIIAAMAEFIPDLNEGFTVRHAFSHPGVAQEGEEGMTAGELMLQLFEGKLFPGNQPSEQLAKIMQAENDFVPFLSAFQFSSSSESSSLITNAHMPASYGAWMTVLK